MNKVKRLFVGGMTSAMLLPGLALAQVPVTTGGQDLAGSALNISGGNLFDLISRIINTILIIAGVVVFAYLIYGGFVYITAGGDSEAAGKGRTAITNAVIGVFVIFISFAILTFLRQRTA